MWVGRVAQPFLSFPKYFILGALHLGASYDTKLLPFRPFWPRFSERFFGLTNTVSPQKDKQFYLAGSGFSGVAQPFLGALHRRASHDTTAQKGGRGSKGARRQRNTTGKLRLSERFFGLTDTVSPQNDKSWLQNLMELVDSLSQIRALGHFDPSSRDESFIFNREGGRTAVERPYHTIRKNDTQTLARFLTKNGQALLPMVELIEQSKLAVDELIDVLGRASVEAVLRLWLSVIAYNLGNLWRRLALPQRIGNWSLTSLQQRLVKTGGRLVKHARYYWLLLAESHLTRRLFASMVRRIELLPLPAG